MGIKTTKYETADYLDSPEAIEAYLEAAFETNDAALIAAALGDVAKAEGMKRIADQSGAFSGKPLPCAECKRQPQARYDSQGIERGWRNSHAETSMPTFKAKVPSWDAIKCRKPYVIGSFYRRGASGPSCADASCDTRFFLVRISLEPFDDGRSGHAELLLKTPAALARQRFLARSHPQIVGTGFRHPSRPPS